MAISVQAMPGFEQWKLILLLRKTVHGGTFPTPRALDVSGARPSDLPELAECGWIEGLRDRHPIDLTEQDNWAQGLASVDLRLTSAGLRWIQSSPFNLILFTIFAQSGRARGASLYRVAADSGADFTWFARLDRAGLVTINRADGEVIDPTTREPVIYVALKETVALTRRGLELVSI